MKKVALISCSKKKLEHRSKARDLYSSQLFKATLSYVERHSYNNIFILSALHGLVDLEDELDPYDLSLQQLSVYERKVWAEKVFCQIYDKGLANSQFYFYTGKTYYKYLEWYFRSTTLVLEGLGIGQRLKFLS